MTLALCALAPKAQAQYQFPNQDFEGDFVNAYTSKGYTEPLGWHGYATIAGNIGSLGRSGTKLVASEDVHEGSTGNQSVCVVANKIFVVANGVMTNGQIYSGSMTATDGTGNYNFSDQTNEGDTNTYGDNDRFYTTFTGRPDYMTVWMKFVPAAEGKGNARASVYLHKDGTVMYDPTDNVEDMSIVVAHAEESVPACGGEWTQYTLPFDYDGEGQYDGTATPGLILATFSTNETPGGGSSGDSLYIDDIEMVYLSTLKSATYNGEEITFTDGAAQMDTEYDAELPFSCEADGVGASIYIEEPTEENNYTLTLTVTGNNISEDETNLNTYTITFATPTADEPEPEPEPEPEADLTLHATWDGEELSDGAVIEGAYEGDKLTVTAGEGATAETAYDDDTLTLTITLTDQSDPDNSQTYTITFTISTAISTVKEDKAEGGTTYDLSGRPMVNGKTKRGVVIRDGKKLLQK